MTLVLGATGQLGIAMRSVLSDATFLTRRDLDLADTGSIEPTLARYDPAAIINCAAYTDVDGAEADEAAAMVVNCAAVAELASYAGGCGIAFVTFSTDYVFDGTESGPYVESDRAAPINAYGRSKACGEKSALSVYPDSLVIRTSWLLSGTGGDFVSKILGRARDNPVEVVDDQRGSPTVASDLAAATVSAMGAGASGLLHLVNEGTASWFEVATGAAALAGIDPSRIIPCSSAKFATAARRPANSALGSERREDLGIEPLPHWKVSLPSVVAQFEKTMS